MTIFNKIIIIWPLIFCLVSYKFVTSGTCDKGDKISEETDCDKIKILNVLPKTIKDTKAAKGTVATDPSGCYAVGKAPAVLKFGADAQKGKCSSTNKCICKASKYIKVFALYDIECSETFQY